MAYKLIWSPVSRDDLRDIVRFIARDNPARAESFGYQLMARAEMDDGAQPSWLRGGQASCLPKRLKQQASSHFCL